MKFSEIVNQAIALVQNSGRVSYRALKMEFDLDDAQLDVLKEELIDIQELAIDKDGKMLVWAGEPQSAGTTESQPQSPVAYTPPHLAERILAEQAAMEARGAADGERKTITALFADLKGSTALIEKLDPEEARGIIDPALKIMMDAVHRYDGFVAQALGDGVFALFGAPISQEDHPQRALYAALQLQEKMRLYSEVLQSHGGAPLQVRVGINTGEVVVRSIRKDDLHTDYVPVGHSTNIAARMEQLAAPDSILVTEQTRKLTEGFFEFKALGRTEVKGADAPFDIYELVGAGPVRTRLQLAVKRGLTRFVGRQTEIELMLEALAQSKAGHGQIVGVMGEPGVGKSRLFHEFRTTAQNGCLMLEAFSVSHGKTSPYQPIIEMLKQYFEIQAQDDERTRREKVRDKVLILDRRLEDTLPYLFFLLSVEDPTSSLQQMDAELRRERTFDALIRLLLRESLNQPLIVLFEDLHWIDNETQEVLDALSERVAGAKILLLVNFRPEYRQAWGGKTYYTQLHLAPLDQESAGELLTFLLGDDPSLAELKQLILERTEGTPFFMEEVVQTLAEESILLGERGNYRIENTPAELHIPLTVQGALAARIDRLTSEEKGMLQRLSVIGREFPLELVRKVVAESEHELYRLLSSLQKKEFLYEQPAFPEVEYIFKHALTQDVSYETVLHDQRKTLHEQTGEAIEALYSANLEDHYGDLALHYTRSGNARKAIEYLYLAGQQAMQRSAGEEAIAHLTQGLELLDAIEDATERAQHELNLQMALGAPLMSSKGWGAPEVERTFNRARELCEQLGDTPRLFGVLMGLWVFQSTGGPAFKTARELAEQLLRLAKDEDDPALLLQAHTALIPTAQFQGELDVARIQAAQAVGLYDTSRHHSLVSAFGLDLGVFALSHGASVLWVLGYPDQAQRQSADGLTLAQELDHPYSIAWASVLAATLHTWRGEVPAAETQAEAAVTLSRDLRATIPLAWATIQHGWTLAEQGQHERGIDQAHAALDILRQAGTEIWIIYYLALMVEIDGKAGQIEDGLAVLLEAQEICDRRGDRWYEAELYRLKGALSLQARGENPDLTIQREAESCFKKAREIAREQSAKSWELRAVTSLARLWQQQGKKTEAHEFLSEIYNWFTEGFDTRDLQDAKALLEELG